MRRAHVIGAGLSGLSTALQLMDKGFKVQIHEAAGQAGGRCRSFHDAALDCLIDNGNHLLLSGNLSAMAFLRRVGAADRLAGPPEARLNFVDLRSGERWTFRPNRGVIPWWIFHPAGVSRVHPCLITFLPETCSAQSRMRCSLT